MQTTLDRFALTIAMAGLFALTASAAPVLTLLPASDVSAGPGGQVGWGFSITNDVGYIEITSAQFCVSPVAFPTCTPPAQGIFTDFISQFNSIIVGPPAGTLPDTVSQAFDSLLLTGIGSFDISPFALIFSADFGEIVLTYNVYSADPNGPGPVEELFFDQVMSANATVAVSDAPEPSSLALVAAGALSLIALRKRRVLS